MKHKRIVSAILSLALLGSGFAFVSAAAAPEQETEVVSESLSNYAFGSMSWGVRSMGLDKLQKKLEASGRELPEVRVAVIDSGINPSNIFLQGRYTDDGYNFLQNNTDIYDDAYHGTMVSGIIADGTTANVKILPLKTNDQYGKGNFQNVQKAIYYAIEHQADVINLSLSADDSRHTLTTLNDAVEAALQKGIVVVVAAGNQGGDAADRYPANMDNVLTIASVNRRNRIALTSNTGEDIDFALPGVNVAAPFERAMFVDSGTSYAAPHAAAAAALLKTWDKSLNQDDIKEILKQYSIDLGEKGFDTTYGWGMVDLSEFPIETEAPEQPKHGLLIRVIQELLNRKR